MKWNHLLIFTILSTFLVTQTYAYIGKFNTDTRWHFTTYDTYLYFNEALYVNNAPKLYNDKLTLTNSYMGSGVTVNTVTISVIQGNLTVTKLMENNIFEATGVASTGNQTEFYVQITTLAEPTTVQINGASISGTSRYADYQASTIDAWCYIGQGKVYLKGVASSSVSFSIDWTLEGNGNGHKPPPTGYYNLTVYARFENNTPLTYTPVNLQLTGHQWASTTDHNGTCLFKNLVEGYYTVSVLNQTKNVEVPFYSSVSFTFKSLPPPKSDFLRENWIPLTLVLVGVLAVVVVYKKKK